MTKMTKKGQPIYWKSPQKSPIFDPGGASAPIDTPLDAHDWYGNFVRGSQPLEPLFSKVIILFQEKQKSLRVF